MSTGSCARCGKPTGPTARYCSECGAPLGGGSFTWQERERRVAEVLRGFVGGPVADRLANEALVEDRRTVTALFADISGFTALAGSLEPVELARVIDPIVAGLTRIVDRYGGAVEKFAGDAILAFFGAPEAHEDDAERALVTALEMHEQLPLLSSHPAAATLSLHIGVNTGEVYARMVGSEARVDYAVLGEAVVLAQRLESLAPLGQTYVGAETARLVDESFGFEDLGALVVKGRADPVPAVRLLGRTTTDQPRRTGGGTVVGRDTERELLARVVTQGSERGVVLLSGEAGVGKSVLAAHAAEVAEHHGVGVVRLAAVSYGATTPYLPFVRALSGDARAIGDPVLAALVGLPGTDDVLAELGPEAARAAISRALVSWVGDRSGPAGLLLVAEDLHWTDAATVEALAEVVRPATGPPVVLVATSRSDSAERAEVLMDAAGSRGRRLDVVPMREDDVRELLAGVLGGPPDDRVVALLHEKGQGNPLFTVELAAMLAEDATVVRRDGRWRLAPSAGAREVPRSLGVLFGTRVDALPPLLVETLWACAVSGRRPDADVVARVLGLDQAVTVDRLGRLAELGFLVRAGETWQFRHALLRQAVDGRLSLERRRDLHMRAAEAVAEAYPPGTQADAAIGAHLMAGEAPRLALPYLVASAAAARSVHAHRDAVPVLREAVSAAAVEPRDTRWPALLADLGDSLEAVGDYEPSRTSFAEAARAAASCSDAELWVQARAREAAVARRTGAYAEALARLDDALGPDGLARGDVRALLLERARTLHLLGRIEPARETLDSALATSPDDPTRGRLLVERAALAARTGDLTLAATLLDEAISLLTAAEDLAGTVRCLTFRGEVHERSGEIDAANRVYQRALVTAEQLGRVEESAAIRNNLGFLALSSEDWTAAHDIFGAAAEEFAQVGHRAGHVTAAANQSYALAMLGELDLAAEISESAARGAEELGRITVAADARTTRALVAKLGGDVEAARVLAVDALETARASGDPELVLAAEELLGGLGTPGRDS